MSALVSQTPLDSYDPLDVIGNGSFGIIRKVRRKSDGVILARKELNFERMSERDKKQIVAEVNILKDLSHENIVLYHDRYIDRDNGILYILMEYCGGGDLGSVIKNCARTGRPLPEDTIWTYFLQILLALHHCHCPGSDGATTSPVTSSRQQILHRDLKPDNVFLDENQVVKLGDFGLSKALGPAAFANTYVGTPYYMSPELMQEKAYDTKSDIWSLGCLLYELCALKPPFHEAKTHSELSLFIRNGRIPPLPRGYSNALTQVIKSMLNINPAMRPSAQQLLHHERVDLARKVRDTEKMLGLAKNHKQMLVQRERDLLLRERDLQAREAELQKRMVDVLAQHQAHLEAAVQTREAELREAVLRKEEELRDRMAKREAELLEAVTKREEELRILWEQYETSLREELRGREEHLKSEWERLEGTRDNQSGKRKSLETPARVPNGGSQMPMQTLSVESPTSVMRGVILTATGEILPTPIPAPHPVELAKLVLDSPRVKLDFSGIFRHGHYDEDTEDESELSDSPTAAQPPAMSLLTNETDIEDDKENVSPVPITTVPPTRLRKPSIRKSTPRPTLPPSTSSCPAVRSSTSQIQQSVVPPSSQSMPPALYDLDDEENLPSPFLKRKEWAKVYHRRPSVLTDLRTKAVTNAALSSGKKLPSSSTERVSKQGSESKRASSRP